MGNKKRYSAYKRDEVKLKKPTSKNDISEKIKEEEERAAAVYEEFLTAFSDNGPGIITADFVKATTSVADGSEKLNNNSETKFTTYLGELGATESQPSAVSVNKYKADIQELSFIPNKVRQNTMSNLEIIKEELIRKHALQKKEMYQPNNVTVPVNNNHTTNIHIANISPRAGENDLTRLFGRFGSLASVKIVRNQNTFENSRVYGYALVAFMDRENAAQAMHCLSNYMLCGNPLKLSWAKALSFLPEKPFYICDKPVKALDPISAANCLKTSSSHAIVSTEIFFPTVETMNLIHKMCEYVMHHGLAFELNVLSREYHGKQFKFLHDMDSPDYLYYRWKLYSILKEGSVDFWDTNPYCIYKGDRHIRPPKVDFQKMTKLGDWRHFPQRMKLLPARKAAKLCYFMKKVDGSRRSVAKMMVWALRHAPYALEIVDHITYFILSEESTENEKVMYLYALSDILYNSSAQVSKAYDFRRRMEIVLPLIIQHLHELEKETVDASKKQLIKHAVTSCLSAWEKWLAYTPTFITCLRSMFLGYEEKVVRVAGKGENLNDFSMSIPGLKDVLRPSATSNFIFGLDGDPLSFEMMMHYQTQLEEIHQCSIADLLN